MGTTIVASWFAKEIGQNMSSSLWFDLCGLWAYIWSEHFFSGDDHVDLIAD